MIVEVTPNIGFDHNMLICDFLSRARFSRKMCFNYEIKWQEEDVYDKVVKDVALLTIVSLWESSSKS